MTIDTADRVSEAAAGRPVVGELEADTALRCSEAASNAIHLNDRDGLSRCFRPGCHVVSGAESLSVLDVGAALSRSSAAVGRPGILTSLLARGSAGLLHEFSQLLLRRQLSTGRYELTLEAVVDEVECVDGVWQISARRVAELARFDLAETSLTYVNPDLPSWQDLRAVSPTGEGRDEIRRVIDGCARAIDRQQAEQFLDRTDAGFTFRVGDEAMTAEQFLAMSRGKEPTRFTCMHYVGPSIVEIEGDSARSVSTLFGVMVLRPTQDGGSGPVVRLSKSTYVDTLHRRGTAWLLADRDLRPDWSATLPTGLAESIAGTTLARRDGSDPSCALLGSPRPDLALDPASERAVNRWRTRSDGRLRLNTVVDSMSEAAEVYFIEIDAGGDRISGGRELLSLACDSDERYDVVQVLSLTEWSAYGNEAADDMLLV